MVDSVALLVVRRCWTQTLLLEERLRCRFKKRGPLALDIRHLVLYEEGGNDGGGTGREVVQEVDAMAVE